MPKIPAELCIKCKGHKYLCGLSICPILERFKNVTSTVSKIVINNKIEGSTPPSILIGEKNYPKVSLVYNIPPGVIGEEAKDYENPEGWWGRKSLNDIISIRSSLISTILGGLNVRDPYKLYEKEISLAGISEKPVVSETDSSGKIVPKLKFDGILIPRGPSLTVQSIKVSENPKVPRTIQKLIFDDLKAEESVIKLYLDNENYYRIISAFSLGFLGLKRNRKLVPTRWSITAVDQIVGNYLLDNIRTLDTIDNVEYYYGSYLGNHFHIILYPSSHSSTWIEIWHPLSLWTTELIISELSENYWGEYDSLDGGYIAARFSIIEKLYKRRRQAGIIIIREITKDYFAPVGNWHIRETVKRALENKPKTFNTIEESLKYVNTNLEANDKINLLGLKSIKKIIGQRRIDEFLFK
ncbi:Nre family DNA repair protein [Sulfolobus acidocaldarius]|uniref:DNA repair protein n=4 Tax=Sulfolobus acidocaldarius TaxID=2285 RepID=Q4J8Z1_SULAC|nr:Nre family DNA repair protein [Sulfolobus acidocaldarius]AAY80739.1 conserved Archaeal protein [Sulfolobus acidocaldarius DSM 639]AGE71336.1 hypothetical protein SacN8_06860 [Sulfolobus acidocaldarius N8]AGE73605.1 hypothetical protein SacRon12I_06850 [Sulfolobus acidocaldarius Ron12/I]ALU30412.1 hypothetical protein ATY89_10970 [Sulfolobus acidocaldarius]ALU31133.1 hypothetical protein ATZ20_02525 [Sulfolobus acidocaldarius]